MILPGIHLYLSVVLQAVLLPARNTSFSPVLQVVLLPARNTSFSPVLQVVILPGIYLYLSVVLQDVILPAGSMPTDVILQIVGSMPVSEVRAFRCSCHLRQCKFISCPNTRTSLKMKFLSFLWMSVQNFTLISLLPPGQ